MSKEVVGQEVAVGADGITRSAPRRRECCAACMLLIRVDPSLHCTSKWCMVLVLQCITCMLSKRDCGPPCLCTLCAVCTLAQCARACILHDTWLCGMFAWAMEANSVWLH